MNIRGPVTAKVIISDPFEFQGPLIIRGPPIIMALWPEYGMDCVETIRPVQIHEPLILIQSNPVDDPESESFPVQSGHNRIGILPNTLYRHVNRHVNINDDVYSWRFGGRTSDLRVTIRRNCIKSLNMGYTLHIYGSIVQSRIRWVGEFLIQSNPNPPGLDWIMNPADWSSPFHTLPLAICGQLWISGNIVAPFSFPQWLRNAKEKKHETSHTHTWIYGRCCVKIWFQSHVKWRHCDVTSKKMYQWPACQEHRKPACSKSLNHINRIILISWKPQLEVVRGHGWSFPFS